MSRYFKGNFLISKIIVTGILIALIGLTQYGLISDTLNTFLTIIALIIFFVIDSNLRKSEQHY